MTDVENLTEAPVELTEGGEMMEVTEPVLTLGYQQGRLKTERILTLDEAEALATDLLSTVAKARAELKAQAEVNNDS